MKKNKVLCTIFLLCLISILTAKQVIIQKQDGETFKCELLYCSDSLLYVWTGFSEFKTGMLENENMQNIHAIRLSQIAKVKLRIPKSFSECGKPAFISTLIAGGVITSLNFREQGFLDILVFNSIFNLIFGTALTSILTIESHIPNNVKLNHTTDLYKAKIKLKRKCLLKWNPETPLIQRLFKEIKPL